LVGLVGDLVGLVGSLRDEPTAILHLKIGQNPTGNESSIPTESIFRREICIPTKSIFPVFQQNPFNDYICLLLLKEIPWDELNESK